MKYIIGIILLLALTGYADEICGPYKLRKFVVKDEKSGAISGSYFLFMGSISGNYKESEKAMFSWQRENGGYQISKVEVEKICVFITNVENPYVIFMFPHEYDDYAKRKYFERLVEEVDIYCKDTDYPSELKISNL